MENLSESIAEIAKAVFPIASKYARSCGETITFTVNMSPAGDIDNHQTYIATAFADALVQTRVSIRDNKAIILGRRGQRAIEVKVESADMDVIHDHIEVVTEKLK